MAEVVSSMRLVGMTILRNRCCILLFFERHFGGQAVAISGSNLTWCSLNRSALGLSVYVTFLVLVGKHTFLDMQSDSCPINTLDSFVPYAKRSGSTNRCWGVGGSEQAPLSSVNKTKAASTTLNGVYAQICCLIPVFCWKCCLFILKAHHAN